MGNSDCVRVRALPLNSASVILSSSETMYKID